MWSTGRKLVCGFSDLSEIVHESVLIKETTRCVDEHNVGLLLDCKGHGITHHSRCLCMLRPHVGPRDHRHVERSAPELQLCDGCSSESVGRKMSAEPTNRIRAVTNRIRAVTNPM